MWPKSLAITSLALAFLFVQNPDTVALIVSPDSQAVILPRKEAETAFVKMCAFGTDDRTLKALAAALNPMPDWAQLVMNKDSSVCNRNPKPIVRVPLRQQ